MAPEVLMHKDYDKQCDMWSAGVILYLILAGVPPFIGKNREETKAKVIEGIPKFEGRLYITIEPIWNEISEKAKDLVKKLLKLDPNERPSASEVLQNPWILNQLKSEELSKNELFMGLKNMKIFKTQMTFQKAVLSYVASQELRKVEEEKLKSTFDTIDKDRNGIITQDELEEGYKLMGRSEADAKEEAKSVMYRIDINRNGTIDYNEFLMSNLNIKNTLTAPRLKKAFAFFDIVNIVIINRTRMELSLLTNLGNILENYARKISLKK